MIYSKQDFATIFLDEEFKLIHLQWHGLHLSHEYRETLTLTLDLIEDKKLTNFLANMQDMPRILVQDAEWREKVWFPRLLKSGLEKAALIGSNDYFNELSTREMLYDFDRNPTVQRRRFLDTMSAQAWLRSNKSQNESNLVNFPNPEIKHEDLNLKPSSGSRPTEDSIPDDFQQASTCK